jgi:hypothetical protein
MDIDSNNPKTGLSNRIKIPIIILTFLTLCALGALFVKIATSVVPEKDKSDRYQYLLSIGDKLKNNGLNEQAIEQYISYLDKENTSALVHARVAHTIGELYMEMSNCREALSWLFRAEIYSAKYQRTNELKNHIDTCLTHIKSAEPKNLTTR